MTGGPVRPSDCDIVVTIFWSRMGTPLEKPLKKTKTAYLSGTEWEFEERAAVGATISPVSSRGQGRGRRR